MLGPGEISRTEHCRLRSRVSGQCDPVPTTGLPAPLSTSDALDPETAGIVFVVQTAPVMPEEALNETTLLPPMSWPTTEPVFAGSARLMESISTKPSSESLVVTFNDRLVPSEEVHPIPLVGELLVLAGLKPSQALQTPFPGTTKPFPTKSQFGLGNPLMQKFFA